MKRLAKNILLAVILGAGITNSSLQGVNVLSSSETRALMASWITLASFSQATFASATIIPLSALAVQQIRQAYNQYRSLDSEVQSYAPISAMVGIIAALPALAFIKADPHFGLKLAALGAGAYAFSSYIALPVLKYIKSTIKELL